MKILKSVFIFVVLIIWGVFISSCHSLRETPTVNLCSASDSVFSSTLNRVASGSESDVSNAVRALPCLDGGNLEDAHIALGEATFDFPKKIVPILESAGVNSNDLIAIILMLPPEYIDESCKSRDELTERRMHITQDAVFDFARTTVLQQLDSVIAKQDRSCQDER